MTDSRKSTRGVENFQRRSWDEQEYKRLAIEREDRERSGKLESSITATTDDELKVETDFGVLKFADPTAAGPSGSSKAYLDVEKARGDLDLESKIGKVEKVVGGSLKAGYRCELCDRTFQDSLALLDHINGREHQSRLGFSMVVKPSTKDEVKSRLSTKIAEKTKLSTAAASTAAHSLHTKTVNKTNDSFEARVKKAEAEMQMNKEKQKQNSKPQKPQKQKPAKKEEEQEEADPEVLAALGFASFGGGK
jgi:U4/U6.U5 tri-snRNP component SNU23